MGRSVSGASRGGLALASLLALACGGDDDSGGATPAPAGPPVGEFRLVDLEGATPDSEKPVTLRVESDGKLGGFSGCNRYFGQWTEQDGRVSFGPMGSTRMACPEPAMSLESRYLGAMGRVAGRRFEDGDLLLLDESDGSILRFVPVENDDR